ncbi:MAG: TIGR00282 family metallophosphoesterase [Cyanobacteria bacterium REEB65]|nr:TIGR00282 family metallophosphoesterase [Cyanobacteria bacterium REEB65]
MFHVLVIGDVVGYPGLQATKQGIARVKKERPVDLVVANGENSDNGFGLSEKSYNALKEAGVNVITLGNHAWDKKEIFRFIDTAEDLLRPANYPQGTPGRGWTIVRVRDRDVAVMQLMGRTYLNIGDCPFQAADRDLKAIAARTRIILVDMHGEATADKQAMGLYLDGRVSAVLGTHTHVQTADEQILSAGTGYISDIGMTGPSRSVLGMRPELSLRRIREQIPVRFEVAEGPTLFCAVWLAIDPETGLTQRIERIQHR